MAQIEACTLVCATAALVKQVVKWHSTTRSARIQSQGSKRASEPKASSYHGAIASVQSKTAHCWACGARQETQASSAWHACKEDCTKLPDGKLQQRFVKSRPKKAKKPSSATISAR